MLLPPDFFKTLEEFRIDATIEVDTELIHWAVAGYNQMILEKTNTTELAHSRPQTTEPSER